MATLSPAGLAAELTARGVAIDSDGLSLATLERAVASLGCRGCVELPDPHRRGRNRYRALVHRRAGFYANTYAIGWGASEEEALARALLKILAR